MKLGFSNINNRGQEETGVSAHSEFQVDREPEGEGTLAVGAL